MRPIAFGILIGGALAALLVAGYAGRGPAAELAGGLCTVGQAGTGLSLTVRGVGASRLCDDHAATVAGWYRFSDDDELAGSLACRLERDGRTFTIRDSGMQLLGQAMCMNLSGP